MSVKAILQFEAQMDRADKINDGFYKATTTKRISLVPPVGVKIYDTDLSKTFVGDGSTNGGVSEASQLKVRTVPIAAAEGTITVSAANDTLTWAAATYLRTGDAVTIAAGTGAIPTGLSAGTYFIKKTGDIGDGKSNTGTTFKVASTRANAVAGTTINITSAGTAGFTLVIAGVATTGIEDVLLISPVSAAIDVYLLRSNKVGYSVTVKRATTATNAVTVKEIDSDNNIKTNTTVDGTTANVVLKAATDDYLNLFTDAGNEVYFTKGKQVTA